MASTLKFRFRELGFPLFQTCQGTVAELGCCKHLGRFKKYKINSFSRLNVEKRGWFCSPGSHRKSVLSCEVSPGLLIFPQTSGGPKHWENDKSHPFSVFVLFNCISSEALWKMTKSWEWMQAAHFYWEKNKIVWEGESHREEAHRSTDPLRLSGSSTEKSQKQPAHQEQDVLQDGVRQMWTVSG